jgi:hypothetical protein
MIRPPAVAGRFYSDQPKALSEQVELYSVGAASGARRKAIACLVPHAGYRFSGHVAGSVYAQLELPRCFLLLGPRHYPRGKPQAILSEGSWQTPLGRAGIEAGLAAELKRACPLLVEDAVAHQDEHALEVQLPFLQVLAGDFRFVPIALGSRDYDVLQSVAEAIAKVLAAWPEPVLMIASSDMNHYESAEITSCKDRMAIERIEALDPRGLYDVVRREGITMCGVGATVSMLIAAGLLGATRAAVIRYATSGDVSGDYDEVVGYAGVIID